MKRLKKLERQFRKHLGNKNAEQIIVEAAKDLNSGQQVNPDSEAVKALEKFPAFIDAVEKSYLDYDDRLKFATRNIEMSSKELTTAFIDLEKLNVNINAMLDSLGQGLLFFGRDGICSPIFSKSCFDLLGCDPSNKELSKVLRFSLEQTRVFHSWLSLILKADIALNFEDMKLLLPKEIQTLNGLSIELDYKPMYAREERLSGILLIVTDVTYKKLAEDKIEETEKNAKKIQEIAKNKKGFNKFIKEASEFIKISYDIKDSLTSEKLNDFLRGLHTYKALASVFNLVDLAKAMHELETEIRKEYNECSIQKKLDDIAELIIVKKKFVENIFGASFFADDDEKIIKVSDIEDLQDLISKYISDIDTKNMVKDFINRKIIADPVFELFSDFEREINRLSIEQEKPMPIYKLTGDNFPLLFTEYEQFFNALVHLARNIVDHGMEEGSKRALKGKPEKTEIIIETSLSSDNKLMHIKISDDGCGINPELIRRKLLDNGLSVEDLSNKSDIDLIQHIFDAGFSSMDTRTMLSGLGIGMSTIKNIVDKMGGQVSVYSDFESKTGTVFNFTLPYRI